METRVNNLPAKLDKNNDAPIAEMRNASFGAPRLRRVLYATFSKSQAILAPQIAPVSAPATMVSTTPKPEI